MFQGTFPGPHIVEQHPKQAIVKQEIGALRMRIARMQAAVPAKSGTAVMPFGVPAIDALVPGHGLLRGALHEVAGSGPETEHAAAAALFVAGVLARLHGVVLWVLERTDLFAPALAGAGLPASRVIFVEAGRHVLAAVEDGLREPGLAGVVGETSRPVGLTASRRLQVTAETSGVPVFLLRRSRSFDDPRLSEPNAAATRWRLAALPSAPPVPHAPEVPGLASALWRLDLIRCRGGEPANWIVEACDAQGRLRLVSDLSDRPAAADGGDDGGRRTAGYRRA
jgi:protein ImuA